MATMLISFINIFKLGPFFFNDTAPNEIYTLPGFTAISMYPMLWEAEGVDKKELIQRLIDLAMVRYDG